MPRPKIHDDALRTTLIDVAGATITAEGYSALSLRRLAADVGTSTTAVYSLFGGKPGLLRELYREAFRRFGEHLNRVRPSDDPVDDIVRLGHAYRASAVDDPHLYGVMFGPRGQSQEPDEHAAAEAAETFNPLLDAVRRAVDSGAFRPLDPALIATALWAGVHGLVSLELGQFLPPQAGPPADVFSTAVRAGADAWRA